MRILCSKLLLIFYSCIPVDLSIILTWFAYYSHIFPWIMLTKIIVNDHCTEDWSFNISRLVSCLDYLKMNCSTKKTPLLLLLMTVVRSAGPGSQGSIWFCQICQDCHFHWQYNAWVVGLRACTGCACALNIDAHACVLKIDYARIFLCYSLLIL